MITLTPVEVRTYREQLDLTQEELATRLGRTRRTVLRWESGETRPSTATAMVLQQLVRESGRGHLNGLGPGNFAFIDLFAGIGGMRLGFERTGGR